MALIGETLGGGWIGDSIRLLPSADALQSAAGMQFTTAIGDNKDCAVDDRGMLERDYTVASRARFRLLCRRGQWVHDASCGSRLWTIKTLREGRAKAATYVLEALKPLMDEGSILGAEVLELEEEPMTGRLGISIAITTPSGEALPLGLLPVGA